MNSKKIISRMEKWLQKYSMKTNKRVAVLHVDDDVNSIICAKILTDTFSPGNVLITVPIDKPLVKQFVTDVLRITPREIDFDKAGSEIEAFYIYSEAKSDIASYMKFIIPALISRQEYPRAMICNTRNRSDLYSCEKEIRFATTAGDFHLLQSLTQTEVIELGRFLGIPEDFLTMDKNYFQSYDHETVDRYIRFGRGPIDLAEKIEASRATNKYKCIKLPGFRKSLFL